jgi:hypothetical protein
MDWIYLLQDAGLTILDLFLAAEGITFEELLDELVDGFGMPELLAAFLDALWNAEELPTPAGADLWYFPFPEAPAFPESFGGIDNYSSYGVRNLTRRAGRVYAGMANPMNLLTDPGDDMPEGGWELIQLEDEPPNTETGDEVEVELEDGTEIVLCDVEAPGYTVGVWLPVAGLELVIETPFGSDPAEEVLLVGSSSNFSECGDGVMASICVPVPPGGGDLFQLQLVEDPEIGTAPGWVNITTSNDGFTACGDINTGYQGLLWDIGFYGYMGIVTVLPQTANPVPAATPWGIIILVTLVAIGGLAVLRWRS